MLEFFAVGAVGFWVGVVAIILTLFYNVESERYFWATFWLIAFTVFSQFVIKYDVFSRLFQLESILWLVGYLVVGTVWSFIKWYLYVRSAVKAIKKERVTFLKNKSFEGVIDEKTEVPDGLKKVWERDIEYSKLKIQNIDENKERITGWIFYWPISMFWFFLRDFLKRIVERIYDIFKKGYQSITNRALKGI